MPEDDQTLQTWLSQASASLSLFGVTIVILYYLLDKRMRKEILAIKYIFFLSISDLLLSIGYLLQGHCQVQARFLQFFSVSSFLWSAIFAHYLFVKRGVLTSPEYIDRHLNIDPLTKPSRRDILYHLIAWGIPLIFTLVLDAHDDFGPAGAWCWVVDTQNAKRMGFFYIPLFIVAIWNSVMLFLFYRAISAAHESERAVRVHKNLALYVVATLFVWCFGLMRRVHEMVSGEDSLPLAVMQSAITPLHGFVNALVYTFSLKAFQRAIRQRVRKPRTNLVLQDSPVATDSADPALAVRDHPASSTASNEDSTFTASEYTEADEDDYEIEPVTGMRIYRNRLEDFDAVSPDEKRRAAQFTDSSKSTLHEPLLSGPELTSSDAQLPIVSPVPVSAWARCRAWFKGLSMQSIWSMLAFAALCLFRGILPLAQKKAGNEFSPMMGNALRSSFGGTMYIATLLSIRLFLKLNTKMDEKSRASWEKEVDWGIYPGLFLKILLIAIFQSQGPVLLISYSVRFIPSGLSAALISTTPLFTLLILKAIQSLRPGLIPAKGGEPKTGWQRYAVLIGVIIGLAGAGLVCIPQMIVQARRSAADLSMAGVGILMSTAAAISIAGAGIYMSNFVKNPGPMVKACYAAITGGILLLVLSSITEVWRFDPFGHDFDAWAWVLLLAATSSYSSNFLNFFLLDRIGALYTSFVWYVVPVVGLVVGALFQNEWSDYSATLIALQCCGCAVIWAGLALTTYPQFMAKK